jgi:hypothetical protein
VLIEASAAHRSVGSTVVSTVVSTVAHAALMVTAQIVDEASAAKVVHHVTVAHRSGVDRIAASIGEVAQVADSRVAAVGPRVLATDGSVAMHPRVATFAAPPAPGTRRGVAQVLVLRERVLEEPDQPPTATCHEV